MRHWLALLLLGLALAVAARAQAPDSDLARRVDQVAALFRGQGDPAAMFTPAFLAQVPPAQLRTVVQQIVSQYGAAQGVAAVDLTSPQSGVIHLRLARATVNIQIAVAPQPPHLISGLLITGVDVSNDSLGAVIDEIRALPGEKSIAVVRLGDGGPATLAALEPSRALAIGSAFKLFILAELNRQIAAGQRHWSDVVSLDRRSIPSGTLQTWPQGSPITLHSLAALMISVSDNTAADTLLHTLGRDHVEQMMAAIGVSTAARNRPFLSTLEMAAIKTGPATALNAWLQADEAGRRRMLGDYTTADAGRIDIARFTGNPIHIDAVEWFASAADMARVMDWLRRNGDATTRAILAINTGLGRAAAGFDYVGYKGGSEPGVLNLTWLIRTRAGAWHVVTGTWNNPQARVEEQRFVALMARAVQLLR